MLTVESRQFQLNLGHARILTRDHRIRLLLSCGATFLASLLASASGQSVVLVETGRLDLQIILGGANTSRVHAFDFSENRQEFAVKFEASVPGRSARTTTVLALVRQGVGHLRRNVYLQHHNHTAEFVAYRNERKEIVANDGNDIVFFDVESLEQTGRITQENLDPSNVYKMGLISASISGDRATLAVLYNEGAYGPTEVGPSMIRRTRLPKKRIAIIDLGERSARKFCFAEDSFKIAISSDGSRVAYVSGHAHPNIFVLETGSCQLVRSWDLEHPLSGVLFLSSDKVLVNFNGGRSKARLLDVNSGGTILDIPNPVKSGFHRAMAVSPDRRWLALDSGELRTTFLTENTEIRKPGVEVWDLQSKQKVGQLLLGRTIKNVGLGWTQDWMFAPDGRTLFIPHPDFTIRCLKFSPDSSGG